MTLKSQIQNDITAHMKAGRTFERDTLRLVLGAIQSAEKSGKTPKDFTDTEVEAFLSKQIKTRRDSATIYTEAGATERATKENAEAELLASYLPEPLTETEVQVIVAKVMQSFENPTRKDMNSIMKAVNAEVKGRFDGKAISQMVGSKLG